MRELVVNHQGDYIKRLMKRKGITQNDIADALKVHRTTVIRWLEKPRLSLNNEGVQKLLAFLNLTKEEKEPLLRDIRRSNARDIGLIPGEQETIIEEISLGRYRMEVELVPIYAQAGYLTDYMDIEYIEELPKHYITIDKYVRGKYRAFEASGDSMDNGDVREAIPDGTIITARELPMQYWTSKLHSHQWPNWIIVHKTEGIVVKQIKNHDVENGVLTLTSLNPDKDLYPDFDVNLDDVLQIYNVVKRELK